MINYCPLGLKHPGACWNCQYNFTKTTSISVNVCFAKCAHPNYMEFRRK